MAEVDGRSTITDIDIVCTPCFEDDIREQAVKFCPECREFLCTGCTRHHGRQRISRSHKLVDKNEAKQGSHFAVTAKCLNHPDRDIEMYCEEHDMVYCSKCIATDHRSCKGVTCLDDLSVSADQKRETERLKADIMNIQERLGNTDKKTKTNLKSIEEQRNDIISQIKGLGRGLVEHIQKLEREALEGLDAEYSLVKGELETNMAKLSKAKQEIEQVRSQLQDWDSLDKIQQFVQTKLTQQTLNDAVKVFEQNEAKGIQSLYLKENTELKSSVSSSTFLGSVQKFRTESERLPTTRTHKVRSQNEENIRMKNDKTDPYTCDVCQLPDGTIILTDSNNMRIKRLDVNYKIKDFFDLETYPRGICCTGNTEVAVKLNTSKVWFISIGSSLSKVRDITVTGGDTWGIAYCAGELWVYDGNGVNVYSMTGTLLKSIINDVNGQRIFTSVQQMTVSGENVYVADSRDGVVCLTRDCTVKRELRDKRLAHTFGVCVSNDGTVFISGYSSHNIMMFDGDGKCLGELVSKDSGLVNPLSLLFDDKRNCLVALCLSGKMIVYDV